jgi:hypothetical protein
MEAGCQVGISTTDYMDIKKRVGKETYLKRPGCPNSPGRQIKDLTTDYTNYTDGKKRVDKEAYRKSPGCPSAT